MSVVRNIDNIKYFAPIAISRLYEKQQQQYFNYNSGNLSNNVFHKRRIQSEKQFEKMQKMMFAKNKDGDYAQVTSPAWKQTQAKQAQQQQNQQKELQ